MERLLFSFLVVLFTDCDTVGCVQIRHREMNGRLCDVDVRQKNQTICVEKTSRHRHQHYGHGGTRWHVFRESLRLRANACTVKFGTISKGSV